jgi:hypothetical protein
MPHPPIANVAEEIFEPGGGSAFYRGREHHFALHLVLYRTREVQSVLIFSGRSDRILEILARFRSLTRNECDTPNEP